MRKTLNTILIFLAFMLTAPVAYTAVVVAQTGGSNDDVFQEVCREQPNATVCQENRDTGNQDPTSNKIYGPDGILTRVARILLTVVAIIAVIMIIISGLRYVMVSGDPSNVTAAKNTLIYAVVGLVLALAAHALIVFVVNDVLQ